MPKIYLEKNVLDASLERLEIVFHSFEHLYFSVSGGKDSSVMIQLAAMVARKLNKKFDVLFIDMEAQYQATIHHIEELKEITADVVNNFYWVALPLSLRNASSVIQPKWICWDQDDKEKWVREMPEVSINEKNCSWSWFKKGMEFETFIVEFSLWYQKTHGGIVGVGIGIRSDESLSRFSTIISKRKMKYKHYDWTTGLRINLERQLDIWNFYPIYDWRTDDIWIAVSKLDLSFNHIYELMYKNGLSIHKQRICQPYGDDQRNSLDQFKALEHETWERVLNRVHGVNFANIYARTSLLGTFRSEKPAFMTWQQYTVWLLETIGLHAPELEAHYYQKIKTFMKWYDEKKGIKISEYPDEADPKLESDKKTVSWRRIARALEKNDFWMKKLSFSQTKRDTEKLFKMREKYQRLIDEEINDKHLKDIAKRMEECESEYRQIK